MTACVIFYWISSVGWLLIATDVIAKFWSADPLLTIIAAFACLFCAIDLAQKPWSGGGARQKAG